MTSHRTAWILGAAASSLLAVAVNVNGCGGDDTTGTTSGGGGATGSGGTNAGTAGTTTSGGGTTAQGTGGGTTGGGSGGTSSTGGTGGGSGTGGARDSGPTDGPPLRDGCTPTFTASTPFPGTTISDFTVPSEAGPDAGIPVTGIAMGGTWSTGGTTTMAIESDADAGGSTVLHISGTGNFQTVSAMFLANGQPIDASSHMGVRLNMRGTVTGIDGGAGSVLLRLQNPINRPEACVCDPGTPTMPPPAATACFGGRFANLGALPATYTNVDKLFTDISSPGGFGLNQPAVDPSNLVVLVLLTDSTTAWDLWIRSVSFY